MRNDTGRLLGATATLHGTMDGEEVTLRPLPVEQGPYGCDWCGAVKVRARSVESATGGPTTGPLICALCMGRSDLVVTRATA